MNIKDELNQIFCEVFSNSKILLSEKTTSNDIVGWDSFSHMNLVSAIEVYFDIEFTQTEALSFKNVGELLSCIEGKIKR
jgi:acyl carrier protein